MFKVFSKDLSDLLKDAHNGHLQLPDFQRDYVWEDEDVRKLIASIARGFPVGALLTLQTGGEIEFKPRLLEGVPEQRTKPEELLLDGQQRITSLYQAMYSEKAVQTRTPDGRGMEKYYYLDIKKAVDGGERIEDAIVGVTSERIKLKNFPRAIEFNLSTPDAEYDRSLFPLNLAYNGGSQDWLFDWIEYWRKRSDHWPDADRDVHDLRRAFREKVTIQFEGYKIPIIQLEKQNSREAICLVFEKVNVGGRKLDTFDLVTAIFAAKEHDLREDWNGSSDRKRPGIHARIVGSPKRDVLGKVSSTEFLQACTLLYTRSNRIKKKNEGLADKELPAISCQRDALLGLPLDAYLHTRKSVEEGFREAGNFLNERKIIWHKDIPYQASIVALAAVFAILKKDAKSAAAKKKLSRWFWSVTLGELYGSGSDTRMARDVPELVNWLLDRGDQPQSMNEAFFRRTRLEQLRSRLSAAYKGVHALVMKQGCLDFISGEPADIMTFFKYRIDIHHIFPKSWCEEEGIDPKIYNSIVNKTPLSRDSNVEIGGDAPSEYLKRIEINHKLSADDLDEILRSHLIEPQHLRNNDFDTFFGTRMNALGNLIAEETGKDFVLEQEADEGEDNNLEMDDGEYEVELEMA